MRAALHNRRLNFAVFLILGALFGCAHGPAPVLPAPDASGPFYSGEREFVEAARVAPSFAGFYYAAPESDTLVVAVANIDDAERARDAVARIFSRKRNLPPHQVLVVRQVRYSFLQLHRWRALVEDRLLKLRQVTMVDLDEGHNTVTVGVLRMDDRAAVDQIMRGSAIPFDAYQIIRFGPIAIEPD